MFDSLITNVGMSVIRNIASAAAASLAAHGYLMGGDAEKFIGSVLFLASMGFSITKEIIAHSKIQAAKAGQ